jgi:hypothetical protein
MTRIFFCKTNGDQVIQHTTEARGRESQIASLTPISSPHSWVQLSEKQTEVELDLVRSIAAFSFPVFRHLFFLRLRGV